MPQSLKMTPIYHPWHKWECYKHGFYSSEHVDRGKEKYAEFFSSDERFQNGIDSVFSLWIFSCEHFLTNESINRIAWIGQASMCISESVPSKYRSGFYLLSQRQQQKANLLAMINLKQWMQRYEKGSRVHSEMEDNGLFGRHPG